MKRILVKFAAALQIVVGALLLVGTVGLATTAYRTVRDESEQLYNDQSGLEILDRIESGNYSWEQLYKDAIQEGKKTYVLRYELGKMVA